MKLAWLVIASLCVVHVAALLGVVGWAGATQRIDRERIDAAIDLFRHPATAEEPIDETADRTDADAVETTERVEQMLEAATAESVAARLESEQRRNEVTLRQIERTREEVQSLSRNLQLSQRRVEEQRERVAEKEAALEEKLREVRERRDEEGFQRAVELIESLPPRQAKEMFVEMLANQEHDKVVAYIMEMQPRRAAGVLREFQTPEEVVQAVELTEMLRARGSRLVEDLEDLG